MFRIFIVVCGILFSVGVGQAVLAATGVADIKGTAPDSQISGQATFKDVDGGLSVEAQLQGVAPGKHGFHIHEFGDCSDHGKAAGSHYNPEGVQHGDLMKEGHEKAHAGDMGNVEIGPDGTGTYQGTLPGITLSGGAQNVGGRAVILHEKEDDFSQPTGNAGGRIGCGTIDITEQ